MYIHVHKNVHIYTHFTAMLTQTNIDKIACVWQIRTYGTHNSYIHTWHTYIHAHTNTNKHTYTNVYIHSHVLINTHHTKRISVRGKSLRQFEEDSTVHTYIYTYTHTHMTVACVWKFGVCSVCESYVHAYIHMYTYAYTHVEACIHVAGWPM